jgi:hypothetical protein
MHRNKFLCNKTNQMHYFHTFILVRNSTCFGQFVCPSLGVYSLYTQQWYMLYRFVDSFRARPGWNSMEFHPGPAPDDGQTNCPKHVVSRQNKFVRLVHLVGFIIEKYYNYILLMVIACIINFGSWSFVCYLEFLWGSFEIELISCIVVLAAITRRVQIPFSSWLLLLLFLHWCILLLCVLQIFIGWFVLVLPLFNNCYFVVGLWVDYIYSGSWSEFLVWFEEDYWFVYFTTIRSSLLIIYLCLA